MPLPPLVRVVVRVAAIGLLAAPVDGAAQGPSVDGGGEASFDGLWTAVTLGGGSARFTCDLCDPERDAGAVVLVAVGARATPMLEVGVEAGAWTRDRGDDRETLWRGGLVAHFFPRPRSGLHLIGGLGWTGYRSGDFGLDTGVLSLGIGWELPLAPGWSVGNALVVDAASFGSLKNDDTRVDRGVGISVLRLGVVVKRR